MRDSHFPRQRRLVTAGIVWFVAAVIALLGSRVTAQTYTASDVDFDGRGTVMFGDLILLSGAFGQPTAAFDGDGHVDFGDFLVLVAF